MQRRMKAAPSAGLLLTSTGLLLTSTGLLLTSTGLLLTSTGLRLQVRALYTQCLASTSPQGPTISIPFSPFFRCPLPLHSCSMGYQAPRLNTALGAWLGGELTA